MILKDLAKPLEDPATIHEPSTTILKDPTTTLEDLVQDPVGTYRILQDSRNSCRILIGFLPGMVMKSWTK